MTSDGVMKSRTLNAVVNCAHCLRFQAWILPVMQFNCSLEFRSNTRRINNSLYALHTHRREFQHLNIGEWVNEHYGTLGRLYEICNENKSVKPSPSRQNATSWRLGGLNKEVYALLNGGKARILFGNRLPHI